MDTKKETLCNLGGRTLCDAISSEQERNAAKEPEQRIPSLHTLAGTQFSSVINRVSENLTELDNALKSKEKEKSFNSICQLGGRELCSLISDVNDISKNLAELEKALAVIGNGSTDQGLKQVLAISEAVAKARQEYPAAQWKEAGQEGIEKAFLAKLKEVENAYQNQGKDAMLEKASELASIKIRMCNKEWQ